MKKMSLPYIVPFSAFLLLTYAGAWIPGGTYLLYPIKTLVVGGLLYYYRKSYPELSVWRSSWLAIFVGILVFIVWIVPEGWYPHLGWSQFNPYPASFRVTQQSLDALRSDGVPDEVLSALAPIEHQEFFHEDGFLNAIESRLDKKSFRQYREILLRHAAYTSRKTWLVILLLCFRFLGAVIVVPIFEELFWRSFAIRWLINEDFTVVKIGTFTWFSSAVIVLGFGFEHHRWLVGILAGIVYNGLLHYKKDLSACVIAHGVTNLLLGIYVLLTQQWAFW